jgi:surfeit locus 1 family protein
MLAQWKRHFHRHYRFERPRLLPSLITAIAVTVTLGLGIWQMQRLAWKEQLITTVTERNELAPLTELPTEEEALKQTEFRTIEIKGRFISDEEAHLAARFYFGELGYGIVRPFALEDGRILLVNEGWVPPAFKSWQKRKALLKEQELKRVEEGEETTLYGMIRTPEKPRLIGIRNRPDYNIWFGRDIPLLEEYLKLDAIPAMLDVMARPSAEAASSAGEARAKKQPFTGLPIPFDGKIEIRNDHFQYMIIWFSLSLIAVVIFLTYHTHRRETPLPE